MLRWSSIVPETWIVAPEAALVSAWLTVRHGLADVQGALSEPPYETNKSVGGAACAAGTSTAHTSIAAAPITAGARQVRSRIATPKNGPDKAFRARQPRWVDRHSTPG